MHICNSSTLSIKTALIDYSQCKYSGNVKKCVVLAFRPTAQWPQKYWVPEFSTTLTMLLSVPKGTEPTVHWVACTEPSLCRRLSQRLSVAGAWHYGGLSQLAEPSAQSTTEPSGALVQPNLTFSSTLQIFVWQPNIIKIEEYNYTEKNSVLKKNWKDGTFFIL